MSAQTARASSTAMTTFVNTLTCISARETWASDWKSLQGKVGTLCTTVKAKACMEPAGSDLRIIQNPSASDMSQFAPSISMRLKCTCSVNEFRHVKEAILQAFGPEWGMAEAWVPGNTSYVLHRAWQVSLTIRDKTLLPKEQDDIISTVPKSLKHWGKSDIATLVTQNFVGYKRLSWWFHPSRTYNADNRTKIGHQVKTALAESLAESNPAIMLSTDVNIENGFPVLSLSISIKPKPKRRSSQQCQVS